MLGGKPRFTLQEIYDLFTVGEVPAEHHKSLVDTLLWFAFLGVVGAGDVVNYSYSVYYDMKKLRKLAREQRDPKVEFAIHRAFWPFLEISPT